MTKLFLPLSIFILTCTHSLAEAPSKTQGDHSTELANAMANTAAIINSIPDIIFYKDIDGVYRTETMISLEESINDKKRLMHSIFNEL